MSISYEEVQVTEELLRRYELKKEKAEGWGKYARFKAWLHYANLRSRQLQGLHESYLVGYSADGQITRHCICGLLAKESELNSSDLVLSSVREKTKELQLDQIQLVKGHRSLDDFVSPTVALIVDFLWDSKIGDYLWTSFCQECGAVSSAVLNAKARDFVATHNVSCRGAK